MAQMLTHIAGDKPVTILTATSGGYLARQLRMRFTACRMSKSLFCGIRAVKISPLQENCSAPWRQH